ncbi:23S rRNA (guanosine-2'-O-)-methyltransferase RlmB [Dyadobacter sp. CECT 9275]|uniref:23S rRNA (Guanosine-2'-O-)-methyltransferase RlmB n=1 Tax=Dyadobacter helix TaxID=2822344 RepID=A0A916NCM2_9BACT|nr:RNA methyltransferase [Dyadobacter sp. CECT 9275]CAG5002947.1 23S rRNA (guanosine-2'-O-)-methyltransferase RlmB [Dyadobacter sp. CECT 9275]
MLSKNRIKYINSLKIKKYRQLSQAFIVEGAKSVIELLGSDFETEFVLATIDFQQKYSSILTRHIPKVETVSLEELQGLGSFQTNDSCIAVARAKKNEFISKRPGEYVIVLDDVRDPGNLGTIIRVADWYGIKNIICSPDTTDWYNPKVIAASKGSFTRVNAFYTPLDSYLSENARGEMVAGAFLGGESLYDFQFAKTGGYIVMGNESNGIGPLVEGLVTNRITIPRYGEAESLNVGIATAVILDNLRRSGI